LLPVFSQFFSSTPSGVALSPNYQCLTPGTLMNNGWADGTTLTAWINQVNASYQETNVLTALSPALQVLPFGINEVLEQCATTALAHVINIGTTNVTFYDVFTQNILNVIKSPCENALFWTGTIANYETFFHGRSPQCNCDTNPNAPCPPGMQLTLTPGVSQPGASLTSYLSDFSTGYFLSGRDYLDAQYVEPSAFTTATALFSAPVVVVGGNDSLGISPNICVPDPQNPGQLTVDTTVLPASFYANKTVVAMPNPGCSYTGFGVLIGQAGAAAVIAVLEADRELFFLGAPNTAFPLVVCTNALGNAILDAWLAGQQSTTGQQTTTTGQTTLSQSTDASTVTAAVTVLAVAALVQFF